MFYYPGSDRELRNGLWNKMLAPSIRDGAIRIAAHVYPCCFCDAWHLPPPPGRRAASNYQTLTIKPASKSRRLAIFTNSRAGRLILSASKKKLENGMLPSIGPPHPAGVKPRLFQQFYGKRTRRINRRVGASVHRPQNSSNKLNSPSI
jgi:hypothetical protein